MNAPSHHRHLGRRSLVTGLALAVLAAGTFWSGATAQDEGATEEETALHGSMETIESALKKLRRTIRKPEQAAESIGWVRHMQLGTVQSKAFAPAMTETVPEAEREAFVLAYQKEMIVLMRGLLDLEEALLNGEHEAAMEIYKKVRAMEDDGHEKFTADG